MAEQQIEKARAVFDGKWNFETNDEAMRCAERMHKMLRGNDDYVANRVILNVTGTCVTLTVFEDATLKLNLADISGDPHIHSLEEWA